MSARGGASGAGPGAGAAAGSSAASSAGSAVEALHAALAANGAAEQALLAQHARLVEASEGSNADDEHDPEGSTIAFERQQAAALLAQVRATGEQLRASLAAAEDGRYGTCERCGAAIDPARLEARPQARTCIGCARQASTRR